MLTHDHHDRTLASTSFKDADIVLLPVSQVVQATEGSDSFSQETRYMTIPRIGCKESSQPEEAEAAYRAQMRHFMYQSNEC